MSEPMDLFIQAYKKALREIKQSVVIDGIVLKKETVAFVAELEEDNRQRAIERALENGDREAFIFLTNKKPLN